MSKAERMNPAEAARARQDPETIVVNAPVGEVGPDPRADTGTMRFGYVVKVDPLTGQKRVFVGVMGDGDSRHEMGGRIPIPTRPFKTRAAPGE